jgi:hypothetical protein
VVICFAYETFHSCAFCMCTLMVKEEGRPFGDQQREGRSCAGTQQHKYGPPSDTVGSVRVDAGDGERGTATTPTSTKRAAEVQAPLPCKKIAWWVHCELGPCHMKGYTVAALRM